MSRLMAGVLIVGIVAYVLLLAFALGLCKAAQAPEAVGPEDESAGPHGPVIERRRAPSRQWQGVERRRLAKVRLS
jgi:hypothetical protein